MVDVSLLVMPFGSVQRPSIGVSLLKSGLSKIGITSRIHYFNLKFAERIGLDVYDKLAETSFDSPLIGELIFSTFVFNRPRIQNVKNIVSQIFSSKQYSFSDEDRLVKKITRIQELVPEFIDDCAYNVMREKPIIVGFSTTFEQNCASLALAKRIKESLGVKIIFGGANCEGQMGASLLRCAPWIDFVCSGEGDIAFIEFMKSFLNGEPDQKVNGIITRESNYLEVSLTNPIMDMDRLPYPEFDDFFSSVRQNRLADNLGNELVIETSRGCWWGEKFQCTFCGLNGSTMKYRSKSVSRVLGELRYLKEKYGIKKFQVVDNIMNMRYIDDLFPQIRLQGLDVFLFYESKSNISREQLALLKTGGVNAIQPGIESLSDIVLKIMKKGVSALQNIEILKWCRELDIAPLWNLLWGFPREPAEEYDRMAEIIPLLTHLHPPRGFGKITLDRFSPYFINPEQNNLANVRPWVAYRFLYPTLNKHDLFGIAYHFDFDYTDGRDPATYTKGLRQRLLDWKKLWLQEYGKASPILNMVRTANFIMIKDTRQCRHQDFFIFADEEADLYELCRTAHNFPSIVISLRGLYPSITEEEIKNMLTRLVSKKLLLFENEKYLGLAVRVNHPR
jgi:ribosomal peptide maturation radical SAM protein 1